MIRGGELTSLLLSETEDGRPVDSLPDSSNLGVVRSLESDHDETEGIGMLIIFDLWSSVDWDLCGVMDIAKG